MTMRPMLCGKLKDLSLLRFPCLLTPKLDGVRCLKVEGQVLSRAFKPIRNRHVVELVSTLPDGVDGELMVPGAEFSDVQSAVMSADGRPDFTFNVFDCVSDAPYMERVLNIPEAPFVQRILPTVASDLTDFLRFEEAALAQGYEGVVSRHPYGPYKFGRATPTSQWMLKHKRTEDSEAVILGLEEARENQNPVVYNAFGHAKRPGGSEGKIPKGTLGSLTVRDVRTGTHFSIGTGKGLTAALRQQVWDDPTAYIGRTVVYTFQGIGSLGRPRFPSFKGFRDV